MLEELMDHRSVRAIGSKIAGGVSLALWCSIVFLGRMIAYNWFDCDRQPQSDLINFLTSCVPTESLY